MWGRGIYLFVAGMFASDAIGYAVAHVWRGAIALGICSVGLVLLNWRAE